MDKRSRWEIRNVNQATRKRFRLKAKRLKIDLAEALDIASKKL